MGEIYLRETKRSPDVIVDVSVGFSRLHLNAYEEDRKESQNHRKNVKTEDRIFSVEPYPRTTSRRRRADDWSCSRGIRQLNPKRVSLNFY